MIYSQTLPAFDLLIHTMQRTNALEVEENNSLRCNSVKSGKWGEMRWSGVE